MAENKFSFVSPGVRVEEIDNSQVPASPEDIGFAVIGRARRGPGMRPVKVSSYSEFLEIFGEPTPDIGVSDVWRDGFPLGPTYGVFAAKAALKSTPVTYIRLLGAEHSDRDASTGRAGWKAGSISSNETGGAFGLFVFPSGSNEAANDWDSFTTGTLAAIWYVTSGSVVLSGTVRNTSDVTSGTALVVESNTSKEFTVDILDENATSVKKSSFSFTKTADNFVRKVFNTNPSLTNSSVFSSPAKYWLGETFEDFIAEGELASTFSSASKWHGVILGLSNGTDEWNDKRVAHQNAKTGWFFSQDISTNYSDYTPENMTNLFKFHALDSGEWNQTNIKISIDNLRKSVNSEVDPYGTFDVLVRKINDKDGSMTVYERFTNLNLNPNSINYIAKRIGDKYVTFDSSTRRLVEYGSYDNQSKFVRVEVSENVENQTIAKESLPYGVYGPVKPVDFVMVSGSNDTYKATTDDDITTSITAFALGSGSIPRTRATGSNGIVNTGGTDKGWEAKVVFPYPRLRNDSRSGSLGQPSDALFGVFTDDSNDLFYDSIKDLVRTMPNGVDSFTPAASEGTDYAWIFTMDDIKWIDGSTSHVQWVSGSRAAGTSITANATYGSILTASFRGFTTVMAGGFDGLDVTEVEPFNNADLSGKTDRTSYAYNSIKQAVDTLRDPDFIRFSDLFLPGIYEPTLTVHALTMCEERGDAFFVMDLENDYVPRAESTSDESSRIGTVSSAISSKNSRGLNSNHGAAYYPWLQMRDNNTGQLVWIPPSVAVAGVYAYTDGQGGPWWSPAGFTRGGLSDGVAGVPIINVRKRLNKKDRDDLYRANINPIASFPQQGIVVWGQKTLQTVESALDRVNVKRMVLAINRYLSAIATRTVFEFNDSTTWALFKQEADIILSRILADRGMQEYRLVLDSTTTTPDLIDRNVMYAKLLIKPTKVAEFIALDLVITNQAANFNEF